MLSLLEGVKTSGFTISKKDKATVRKSRTVQIEGIQSLFFVPTEGESTRTKYRLNGLHSLFNINN